MKIWNAKDPNGEPEGVVDNPNQLLLSAATDTIVKDMADVLTRAMPGFHWAIQPSEFGGVFNVFCLDFSGRWGYRLKYKNVWADPKRRCIIEAGREILYRFGYEGIRYDPMRMKLVLRKADGEAIPDLSDQKNSRFKRRAVVDRAIAQARARIIGDAKGKDGSEGIVLCIKE